MKIMIPLLNLCQNYVGNTIFHPRISKHFSPFLFVGGIVRDYILHLSKINIKPNILSSSVFVLPMEDFEIFLQSKHDVDISTTLPPKDATKVLGATFPSYKRDRKYATNILRYGKVNIDCTSTRIDTECDGRNAKMEFGVSYFQDSIRRDFTFNAMYMSSDGMVFDFHNGLSHLLEGKIKFIGDARMRILEDYTRIKRYRDFSKRFHMRNMEIESIIDDIIKNATQPIIMR